MDTNDNYNDESMVLDEKYILKPAEKDNPFSSPVIDIPRLLDDTFKRICAESDARERSMFRGGYHHY